MRSSSMIFLGAIALVAVLSVAQRTGTLPGILIDQAQAAAPAPAPIAFRTVTSSSCSSNGCPTACEADEALVSAICIGPSSAKFSDNLQFDNGQMTASCGPSTSTIVVSCVRK